MAADDVSPDDEVFSPETDRLIRDVATMSDRWTINPFMFGQPSARSDRGRRLTLRDAFAALGGRRRRRREPSGGE